MTTQSYLTLLALYAIVSSIGIGCYAACRFAEQRFSKKFLVPTACVLSICACIFFVSEFLEKEKGDGGLSETAMSMIAAVVLVSCSFGVIFHRKTGESSNSWPINFINLFFSVMLSFTLGALLTIFFPQSLFFQNNITLKSGDNYPFTFQANLLLDVGECYYFMLLVSPTIAPLLLWLYRTSQLRPGIDKHFDE